MTVQRIQLQESRQQMNRVDQPSLELAPDAREGQAAQDPTIRDRIRALLDEQPFAVLCTQGEGQPYGSVIAFAFGEDLRAVAFCTPVATRKYRLLSACKNVALVVDSRCQHLDNVMQVEALTATGRAVELESGPDYERWTARLVARHPQLKTFVAAPSSALFCVEIVRYLHVTRFQEVHQWIPAPTPPQS
jgi:nitroimidazol reductase NimA-like FMN-containing flavoprotein (pyridoxamine 5'-phosphate oxidase superfamily)